MIDAEKKFDMPIVIPDDILVRSGISCGDDIIVQAALNDDVLEFNFACEACTHCRAAMNYIYARYNQKPLTEVIDALSSDCSTAREDFEGFCERAFGFGHLSKPCVIKPMEICLQFFEGLRHIEQANRANEDTKRNLDCDACVSTGRVDWRHESAACKFGAPEETPSDYPLEYRERFMPLAKIFLNTREISELRKVAGTISQADVMKFLKMKIDQMIFFNVKKYCGAEYLNPIWRNIRYRQYREVIVRDEIEALKKFMIDNSLKAYFVKGAFMRKFYTSDAGLRLFLDYDIVAASGATAFNIATYLFRRGFKIFYSEYSIKKIQSDENDAKYTGHFHLQKLIFDRYKVIVDINFPAFPMGRVALYSPQDVSGDQISLEDEFIITLCHLFKHKDVFMKDINDLYLLLREDIRIDVLRRLILENRLNLFCATAVKYIIDNYDLPTEKILQLTEAFEVDGTELGNWPYDYRQVYALKRRDLNERVHIFRDNDRMYFFPLVLFDKPFEMSTTVEKFLSERYDVLEKADESLYMLRHARNDYLICGMGIFWNNANDQSEVVRSDVEQLVNEAVDILQMRRHAVYMPYRLARQDKWFF